MTFTIDPGPLALPLESAYVRLEQCRFTDALWARRLDVWAGDAGVQQAIANRLGWLDAGASMRPHVPRLRAFALAARDAGFGDVVLLGMGGSSLAPDVLRAVIGAAPGWPRFQVLDSIDPEAVRAAMARPASTLFIVASKSGSTIEVTSLAAEAERRVRAAGVAEAGSHFVAITDANTALHRGAIEQRFRDVFVNPADIGGRYSALSFFGLVPAALMGLDIDALVSSAHTMAEACRLDDPRHNPGLALGAAMAAAAMTGRDKLTLGLPPRLARFGLWIEQLVAESTGKQGHGIVPIAGEAPAITPGDDRLVVITALHGQGPVSKLIDHARTARAPVVTLDMPDVTALGGEFFRWEVATATAGLLLDINPFDEPNVQQAKDATRALLEGHASTRRVPMSEPDAAFEGSRITLTTAAKAALGDAPITVIGLLRPHDYCGLLAYLPEDERFAPILERLRTTIAAGTGCGTTLGYGPRYLHSTGQLHKGGPNTGVFLLVTAEASEDLPIPGESHSFGVLEMAQAVGDLQSLERTGRRVLHVHLPSRDPELLQRITGHLVAVA